MSRLSNRAQGLAPSATLATASKAAAMRAAGIDVISFAMGEPDFDTPLEIRNACKSALDEGFTRYAPSSGMPGLRVAIAKKLESENNLAYADDEIVVTCGAKQAIYNALQVTMNSGDEVLIPAPYWVSYPEHVKLADGKPVIVPTDEDTAFKVTPAILEKFVTAKTRAFILNSPSNPTGSAYSRDELANLGKFFKDHDIIIISDEIYEKLIYDNFSHISIADAYPPAKDLAIVINGVSKAYAMTGWRMGYAAGPKDIISKMSALGGQQITGIPAFVQKACAEAIAGSQEKVDEMRREFAARRDLMHGLLLRIPKLRCPLPSGAFYLFPDVSFYLKKNSGIDSSVALSNYLLEEAHVATVNGDAFGSPGHIRLSYAASREKIEEGMRRLKSALEKL